MLIDETTVVPMSPYDVRDLMATEDFQRTKAERLAARDFGFEVVAGAAPTVVTRRRFPTDRLPELLKPMLDPSIVVTETERWQAPEDVNGVHTGVFEVDVAGAPVKVRGTVSITPHQEGCELRFAGELRSSVPLFRSKIEQAASGSVLETIHVEFALLHEHALAAAS